MKPQPLVDGNKKRRLHYNKLYIDKDMRNAIGVANQYKTDKDYKVKVIEAKVDGEEGIFITSA